MLHSSTFHCCKFQKTVPLDPKVACHLLLVFGLIAVTILSIVKVLRILCEKYSDWKDRKENLKRQEAIKAKYNEEFVAKKFFKSSKDRKGFVPPKNIFDDV